jgi:hypothetical protein
MGPVTWPPLSEDEVDRLLNDLCVDLGFCLPPDDQSRLRVNPPGDADTFTDAVFMAEGLDPLLADRHLWRTVRQRVVLAFRRQPSDPDRRRRLPRQRG